MQTEVCTEPVQAGGDPLALFCALNRACAQAESPGAAAEEALAVLRDAGFIQAGAVVPEDLESGGAMGDPALLETLQGRASPAGHLVRQRLPTRAAPAAVLCLAGPDPLPAGLAAAAADALALALDRLHLQNQARELHRQAERRIAEVSTIYEIGRAIDSVEIDRLLQIITEKAARVMQAQACSLMRLNPETNALTIAASFGLSEDVVFVTNRALGEGIAGRVAQTGEPMLIVDSHQDPRLQGVPLRPEIGSSMVVPMKDELGRVLGVLSIRRRRPAPDFDQDSLRLFSVFASQAALAISNFELYSSLKGRVTELSTLADLTQALITTLDLNSLLNKVADCIVNVVRFDRCCLFLRDRETRRYVARIVRGYRVDTVGRNPVKPGEGVVGIVARKKMPILETDARNALQPMRGFARALGTNAFVALPVMAKGQVIGVVVADNKLTGRRIHPESVELLTTFVNEAGLALENAQLYEDRELRYQEMNRLATQTDNILRSIASSVVVTDDSGRVTRWNKASEEMWGLPEEEALGLRYSEVIQRFGLPPDACADLLLRMEQVRQTGRPSHAYKLALHSASQPSRIVNALFSPLVDRQGERQGVIQIMEDVTREIRMEAEVVRMRRLADLGQLAATIAHEVRNPLSSIKGAAQLMRNEYEDLAPLQEFVGIIVDEVNTLSRITTDLLDFARPMQMDLQWTRINDVVERTLGFLAPYLEESRVAVHFEGNREVPQVLADPQQIEQVLRNLLINAAQAMPQGGTALLETGWNPEDGSVWLRITDHGAGIPEHKLETIFQPFVTSKTKGTGLGLPIVQKIVENHGGTICVSSRLGQGTTFTVTLPRRPAVSDFPEEIRLESSPAPQAPLPDME